MYALCLLKKNSLKSHTKKIFVKFFLKDFVIILRSFIFLYVSFQHTAELSFFFCSFKNDFPFLEKLTGAGSVDQVQRSEKRKNI